MWHVDIWNRTCRRKAVWAPFTILERWRRFPKGKLGARCRSRVEPRPRCERTGYQTTLSAHRTPTVCLAWLFRYIRSENLNQECCDVGDDVVQVVDGVHGIESDDEARWILKNVACGFMHVIVTSTLCVFHSMILVALQVTSRPNFELGLTPYTTPKSCILQNDQLMSQPMSSTARSPKSHPTYVFLIRRRRETKPSWPSL